MEQIFRHQMLQDGAFSYIVIFILAFQWIFNLTAMKENLYIINLRPIWGLKLNLLRRKNLESKLLTVNIHFILNQCHGPTIQLRPMEF